jgi:hypothetical protein
VARALGRRIVLANIAVVAVVVLIAVTAVVALRTTRQNLEEARAIDHRLAVIDRLRTETRELQLSARRFVMTGDLEEQQRVFAIVQDMRAQRARLGPATAFKHAARLFADLDEYVAALTALMSVEDSDPIARLSAFEDDLARIRAPLAGTFDEIVSAQRMQRESLRSADTLARGAQWGVGIAGALAVLLLGFATVDMRNAGSGRDARSSLTRSRNELLAAATDLRAPLENIIAESSRLRLGQHDAMTTRGLEDIAKHASRVNAMLAELLDVSAIQTGATALRREPVDAGKLVARVIEDHVGEAEQRGIRLRYDSPLGTAVFADRERIKYVLSSLLEVSIASVRSGAELAVHVAAMEAGIRFTIIEPGPGTDSHFGHDLALHLCSRVVEAHGGRLGIQTSAISRTYWFTLPTEPALLH